MFNAFSPNIQSSNGTVRNTTSISFLRGVGGAGKYSFNMLEVELTMGATDGGNFSEAMKEHVRSGPCGAGWIAKISTENAGAASSISPLHKEDVKDHLMDHTGYCLNVGDGNGTGGGGLYHFSYGVASKAGARAWVRGCSEQHLRASLENCMHLASVSSVHGSSVQPTVQPNVANPEAPPAQPGGQEPSWAPAAAVPRAAGEDKAPSDQVEQGSPKNGVGPAGPSLIECRKLGCTELFETNSLVEQHQNECTGMDLMDEVGSKPQSNGQGSKRAGDTSWDATDEENKKPRPEEPVEVRILNDLGAD